jgi:alpha-tubulin suppressor-like RCC1 family protein
VIGDGDGGTSRNLPTRVIFSDDTNSTGFVSIDAGNQLNCGVTGDGKLWCWGWDAAGAIGASPTEFTTITKATRVGGASNWTSVATGYAYACARTATGAASCFGSNYWGQVGNGTRELVAGGAVLGAVAGDYRWDDIGLGDFHTCGIDGGDLYCWGYNASGRVDWANGDESFSEPKRVAADASWSDVDNGSSVTCGITNGDVWCWGNNSYGMLGDADTGLINVARWVIDGAGLPPTSAELPWPSAALAAVAALLAVAGVALRRRSPARRFR